MAIAPLRQRPLTPRQREVIRLVAHGAQNKDVARTLGITEQGVKAHVSRLLERYGAGNRVELIRITRAWEDADARALSSVAPGVNEVRQRLADDALVDKITQLARTLRELDVAIVLAQELPDEGGSPMIDLVRRRVGAAKDLADSLIETLGARAEAL